MNKVFITGNLTRDPVTSVANTVNGQVAVCRFTVAVSRRGKAKGESNADFFDVTAWRTLADTCGKYLRKGSRVAVEGSISLSTSVSKRDGKTYSDMEISATEVEFMDKVEASGGSFTPVSHEPRSFTPPAAPQMTPVDDPDDPFKPKFPDGYDPNDLPF